MVRRLMSVAVAVLVAAGVGVIGAQPSVAAATATVPGRPTGVSATPHERAAVVRWVAKTLPVLKTIDTPDFFRRIDGKIFATRDPERKAF